MVDSIGLEDRAMQFWGALQPERQQKGTLYKGHWIEQPVSILWPNAINCGTP